MILYHVIWYNICDTVSCNIQRNCIILYKIQHGICYNIISYNSILYQSIKYHINWYDIILYDTISKNTMSYHITWYYIISCHKISHNIISCNIVWYNIILYITLLCCFMILYCILLKYICNIKWHHIHFIKGWLTIMYMLIKRNVDISCQLLY